MLNPGAKAPSFEAETTQGPLRLDDYLGKQPIVLIFYPKDDTPICTRQLCAVRDSRSLYAGYNAAVFGINPAKLEEHRRFSSKFKYDFPLVSDRDEQIRQLYDVRKIFLLGQQRCVFVIGQDGHITYAKKGNRPTKEILAALEQQSVR